MIIIPWSSMMVLLPIFKASAMRNETTLSTKVYSELNPSDEAEEQPTPNPSPEDGNQNGGNNSGNTGSGNDGGNPSTGGSGQDNGGGSDAGESGSGD